MQSGPQNSCSYGTFVKSCLCFFQIVYSTEMWVLLGVLFLLGSRLCGTANNENKVKKLEHSSEGKPQRMVMVPIRHRATLSSDSETAFQAGGGLFCPEN